MQKPIFNGIMLGLILPVVAFLILAQIKSDNHFDAFIANAITKVHLPAYIRMCVFVNLPVFLLFNFMKRFEVCMGIFVSTILYIVLMLVVRYLL